MNQYQIYNGNTAGAPGERYHSGKLLMKQLELSQANTMPQTPTNNNQHVFQTLDNMKELAHKLVDGLNKLGQQNKYPLSIRKGVRHLEREKKGEMLKASTKTYFFDIKETRESKPFLVITESRLRGEGQKAQRSSIMIFEENIEEFAALVSQMAEKITQGN